jgi:hypothetical protein
MRALGSNGDDMERVRLTRFGDVWSSRCLRGEPSRVGLSMTKQFYIGRCTVTIARLLNVAENVGSVTVVIT